MSSINTKDSKAPELLPRQEHRTPIETDDNTGPGGFEEFPDGLSIKNKFYILSAESISNALDAGEYDKARYLALQLRKWDGVPLECSITVRKSILFPQMTLWKLTE
jgi:hypothetical protein